MEDIKQYLRAPQKLQNSRVKALGLPRTRREELVEAILAKLNKERVQDGFRLYTRGQVLRKLKGKKEDRLSVMIGSADDSARTGYSWSKAFQGQLKKAA